MENYNFHYCDTTWLLLQQRKTRYAGLCHAE